MAKNAAQPQGFSLEQARKVAQSESGKQLFSALQQSHSEQIRNAMEQASAGDYDSVRKTLAEMLNDPKVKELMQKMGGQHDG